MAKGLVGIIPSLFAGVAILILNQAFGAARDNGSGDRLVTGCFCQGLDDPVHRLEERRNSAFRPRFCIPLSPNSGIDSEGISHLLSYPANRRDKSEGW